MVFYTLDKSLQLNNSRNKNIKYYMATSSVIDDYNNNNNNDNTLFYEDKLS
jgi:hypothetical protein